MTYIERWSRWHSQLNISQTSSEFFGNSSSKVKFKIFETSPVSLFSLQQVHGVKILEVNESITALEHQAIEGDGLYSFSSPNNGNQFAIKTADCLPIIIKDSASNFRMVLHAGWKGLAQGILNSGLALCDEFKINRDSLFVGLGPCIGPKRFEVKNDVIETFNESSIFLSTPDKKLYTTKYSKTSWNFDLQVAALYILFEHTVPAQNISILRDCTFDNDDWPSYRRSGGQEIRRIYTII